MKKKKSVTTSYQMMDSPGDDSSNRSARPQLKKIAEEGGARAAMAYLNSLGQSRFTALYRFDGDTLHNCVFFDRENPEATKSDDIPVMASYCVFVRDSKKKFTVTNAQYDERVDGHPKQKTIQSYCGVPLMTIHGAMFGTVCHFDFAPGKIDKTAVDLLEYVASVLPDRPDGLSRF
ncbi:MAG: hypothetical protein ABI273_12975 [Lacunisphaera sp.]